MRNLRVTYEDLAIVTCRHRSYFTNHAHQIYEDGLSTPGYTILQVVSNICGLSIQPLQEQAAIQPALIEEAARALTNIRSTADKPETPASPLLKPEEIGQKMRAILERQIEEKRAETKSRIAEQREVGAQGVFPFAASLYSE